MDINTDIAYTSAMDKDMALSCSSGTDVTMAPVVVCHSDTNVDGGGSPYSRHLHGLQGQLKPLTITQTLGAVGLQTQIQPLAAAQAQISSWSWLAVQTTQTGKLQWQQNPMDANMAIHRLLVATWPWTLT